MKRVLRRQIRSRDRRGRRQQRVGSELNGGGDSAVCCELWICIDIDSIIMKCIQSIYASMNIGRWLDAYTLAPTFTPTVVPCADDWFVPLAVNIREAIVVLSATRP